MPFSFVGTDQSPTGYSIDLCRQVVGALQQSLGLPKLQIKWVSVTPESRISAVAGGSVDLECGSTTHTLSRQEQVDFSLMTFVDGGSLLVTTASGIKGRGRSCRQAARRHRGDDHGARAGGLVPRQRTSAARTC